MTFIARQTVVLRLVALSLQGALRYHNSSASHERRLSAPPRTDLSYWPDGRHSIASMYLIEQTFQRTFYPWRP